MSICSSAQGSARASANRPVYVAQFRRYVHRLIFLGYQRLDPASYHDTHEPAITGELVRAMREVTESPNAPRWVFRMAIHDDPPVNKAGRYGKDRQRVDIEFERAESGPRRRMQFEAKRLHTDDSVSDYVGSEGLGCFLDGEYAATHSEAGMLGYVQNGDEPTWAAKIAARLSNGAGQHGIRQDSHWKHEKVISELSHTYATRHDRQAPLLPIGMRHVLLRFC